LVLSCTVSELQTFYVLLTPPLFNPNFGGVPVAPDRPCWASASTWTLSYSAVKLFSKNSNLFEHGTWSLRTDGQTDRRLTVASPRSALASRGKNWSRVHLVIARTKRWTFLKHSVVASCIIRLLEWPGTAIMHVWNNYMICIIHGVFGFLAWLSAIKLDRWLFYVKVLNVVFLCVLEWMFYVGDCVDEISPELSVWPGIVAL